MKLLTKKLKDTFKKYPLYSQDGKGYDATVICKFFLPCSGATWIITEGEPVDEKGEDYEFFGWCCLGDEDMAELGYVRLSELQSLKDPYFHSLGVERDIYMKTGRTLKETLLSEGHKIPDSVNEEKKGDEDENA